jgi:hypothetical protein
LCLASRNCGALHHGTVQALEMKQKASVIDDGYANIPIIFLRFNFAGGYDFVRVFGG